MNNMKNATPGPDPSGKTSALMYEQRRNGDVVVSYHLDHYSMGKLAGGYRLSLLLKNAKSEPSSLFPTASLLDANGTVINPASYEQFLYSSSALAGTPVPKMPPPPPGITSFSGSFYNYQTGEVGSFNGYARPRTSAASSFAAGFEQGAAAGDAIVAAAAQGAGDLFEFTTPAEEQ